jgi:hypothetical protein
LSLRIISNLTINRLVSFAATTDGVLPQGLTPASFALALRFANEAAFKLRYPQSAAHELDQYSFDWLPLVPPHSVLSALEDYLYNGGDEVDNETMLILQRIRAKAISMTLPQQD